MVSRFSTTQQLPRVINTLIHTGHAPYRSHLRMFSGEMFDLHIEPLPLRDERSHVYIKLNSPVKGLACERIVIAHTQRIDHNTPVTESQNSDQIELMHLNTHMISHFSLGLSV